MRIKRHLSLSLIFLTLLLVISSGYASFAAVSHPIRNAIRSDNSRLYVPKTTSVTAVNISNPASPTSAGSLSFGFASPTIYDLLSYDYDSNNYLFVSTYSTSGGRIYVFDIDSDPGTLLTYISLPSGVSPRGVAVGTTSFMSFPSTTTTGHLFVAATNGNVYHYRVSSADFGTLSSYTLYSTYETGVSGLFGIAAKRSSSSSGGRSVLSNDFNIYVSSVDHDTILKIKTADESVTTLDTTATDATYLTLSDDNDLLFARVLQTDADIRVFDVSVSPEAELTNMLVYVGGSSAECSSSIYEGQYFAADGLYFTKYDPTTTMEVLYKFTPDADPVTNGWSNRRAIIDWAPGSTDAVIAASYEAGWSVWRTNSEYGSYSLVVVDTGTEEIGSVYTSTPSTSTVYPNKGPNDQINHVVVTGDNFYEPVTASIVSYDGATTYALSNVQIDSETMIEADIPAGTAVGSYEITVTSLGGTYTDSSHVNPNNDYESIAAGSDTTKAATVENFSASENEDSQVTLTWTNPVDGDLREIKILRKTGSYPTSHSDTTATQAYDSTIPQPGASVTYVDASLTNGTTYYYAVFNKDTSNNWNDTVTAGQNADTGRPNNVTTGSTTHKISYLSETQAENWISLPYESAEGAGGISLTDSDQLINSIATSFVPEDFDLVTISGRDNETQYSRGPIQYMYLGGGWDSGGTAPLSLTVGEMYKITISNAMGIRTVFTADWTVSGAIPTTLSMPLSYLSETQAENWLSIPISDATLTDTDKLITSLATKFTPEDFDLVTVFGRDNETQYSRGPIQYMYIGGDWDSGGTSVLSINPGDPWIVTFSNAMGTRTVFTTTWPN